MDLFKPVPMGVSMRGKPIETDWVERSGLFGGEPGAGKSAAVNNVLLAAALDPYTRLYLADGKAGFDLVPFESIAEMIDTAGDPEALLSILTHVGRWRSPPAGRRCASTGPARCPPSWPSRIGDSRSRSSSWTSGRPTWPGRRRSCARN
ncbi:FtsK/SpoIIIE domain-containing protein [Streptomyces zhihengii]